MRRLLLLTVVVGCVVSLIVSGRLTARLAADGIVSFAFIPVIEIASFALVWRRVRVDAASTGLSFAEAFDRFALGDTPWLYWMLGLAVIAVVVPPHQIGTWAFPLLLSSVLPFARAVASDLRFFRDAMGRPARSARRDVIVLRAVAWTAGLGYFLGIAIWAEIVPRLDRWFGA
jgi:hypothetical protein